MHRWLDIKMCNMFTLFLLNIFPRVLRIISVVVILPSTWTSSILDAGGCSGDTTATPPIRTRSENRSEMFYLLFNSEERAATDPRFSTHCRDKSTLDNTSDRHLLSDQKFLHRGPLFYIRAPYTPTTAAKPACGLLNKGMSISGTHPNVQPLPAYLSSWNFPARSGGWVAIPDRMIAICKSEIA